MRFPLVVVAATAAIALAVPGPLPAAASPLTAPAAPAAPAAEPDFDGDGTVDLAVSVIPDEQMTALRVHYGSGATVTVSAPELTGDAEGQVRRGLVAHDLDADGYTDLAVGAAFGTTQLVYLLFGSASGLDFSAPVAVPAPTQVDDKGVFGESLAVLDAPVRRLAVGIGYGYGDFTGGVAVYDLDADGVPSGAPTLVTPSSVGIGDSSSYFGQSVAATGSLLFVGAPVADVGPVLNAGAVAVLTMGPDGVRSSRILSQATAGVAGVPARGDAFGYSLAAGQGYLAVGAPGDAVGPARATGSVAVFRVSGTTVTPRARISQSSSGVPGIAEKHDRFGHAVALGTVCTGVTGVVVGGPGEAIRTSVLAGAAWVVPLSPSRTCTARQLYAGHGLPGTPAYGMFLGSSVGVARDAGTSRDTVVIGGAGDYHQSGRLITWSTRTHTTLASRSESVLALAGR